MSFNTGSSEKMRIDNSGHVAIGSPSSLSPWRTTDSVVQIGTRTSVTQLSVDTHLTNNGYFSQTSGWFAQDTAKCSNYYQSDGLHVWRVAGTTTASASIAWTEAMRIDNTGNVFIGRVGGAGATDHGFQFYNTGEVYQFGSATGNSDLHRWYNGSGTKVAYLQGDGDLVITGTYSPSDERLKENIVDAPAGNIDDLKVRSFDWKADGEHQKYGFIAQELNSVAPYAVNEGETEEDMLAVNYAALVPMLVKEIQDLKLELQKIKDTI
jgi:hypothetical protein